MRPERTGRAQRARLAVLGHGPLENPHGLIMDGVDTPACGQAEGDWTLHVPIAWKQRKKEKVTVAVDPA